MFALDASSSGAARHRQALRWMIRRHRKCSEKLRQIMATDDRAPSCRNGAGEADREILALRGTPSGTYRGGTLSMRSDDEIKRDVEEELAWDPDIDNADIAVAVKDGVVTLSGFARSYGQRRAAEEAAKRVAGVLGVVNDVEVRLPIIHQRPDPEIARDAVDAIKLWLPFSYENIKVVVKDGWITLEGPVE
jgi:hypothetical protein